MVEEGELTVTNSGGRVGHDSYCRAIQSDCSTILVGDCNVIRRLADILPPCKAQHRGYTYIWDRPLMTRCLETPPLLRRRLLLRHLPLQLPPSPVRLFNRTFLWRLLSYR